MTVFVSSKSLKLIFFLVNCVTWHFYMLLCTLSHGEAFSFIVHSSGQQKQHLPLNVHQWSINSCLGEADSLNWPVRSRLKASLLPAPLTYGDKWTPACIVLLTRLHSVSLVFVTGPMVGRCKWDRAFRRGGGPLLISILIIHRLCSAILCSCCLQVPVCRSQKYSLMSWRCF